MTTQTVEVAKANASSVVVAVRSGSKSRLLYLDNLRMAVITFVVLEHLAITYGILGDWYYHETGEMDTGFTVIMLLLGGIGAAFTMGLLFLVAGYFTPRSYDRKGGGHFLVDRLKRLGLPLLFYVAVVVPAIKYSIAVHDGYRGSLEQWLVNYFRGFSSIGDGPVWFLEELLIFCIFYALWRLLLDRVAQHARVDQAAAPNPPANWMIGGFVLSLALVTFVVRIWAPSGMWFEPWHLELARAPQYIALFVVGIVAYRGNWLERFTDTQVRTWRWIALVCILLMPALAISAGALTGQLDKRGAGGLNWLSLEYSLWEGVTCVSLVIVVLAWFRKRFDRQNRLAKAMSDNCFAVYILHPILIVPLALVLSGISLNLGLKFIVVAPVAVALCYLVAYLLRKIPFVRSVL